MSISRPSDVKLILGMIPHQHGSMSDHLVTDIAQTKEFILYMSFFTQPYRSCQSLVFYIEGDENIQKEMP